MSEIIVEGFKIKQSRILDNILVTGNKLSNQRTGYQKTATLKAAFLEKKTQLFLCVHLARKHYSGFS